MLRCLMQDAKSKMLKKIKAKWKAKAQKQTKYLVRAYILYHEKCRLVKFSLKFFRKIRKISGKK